MIYSVNSVQGLTTALKVAGAGDEIRLAAGDYGSLKLSNINVSGGELTIVSANFDSPAKFSGIVLDKISGLTLKNLEVETTGRGIQITNSEYVKLDGLDVHGKMDAAIPEGGGVYVDKSDHVTVVNTDFHHLGTALSHDTSTHLKFNDNKFSDIRTDGIRGGGSSYVEISGNYFTDFYRQPGDHPDAIQFWTTNTTSAAHDIVVTGNVFVRGDGNITQGIFFRDESGKMPYENVVISGNAIIGGMYNGISMIGGKSVEISDNLVVGYSDMVSWIRVENSSDVALNDNSTTRYFLENNGSGVIQAGSISASQVLKGDASVLEAWLRAHPDGMPAMVVTRDAPLAVIDNSQIAIVKPGTSGADSLVGTSGADLIDGGAGNDTMVGGAGNDLYFVHDKGDVIIELAGGGIDTVRTNLAAYTLPTNVENLVLALPGVQSGTGNDLDNVITMSGGGGTVNAMGGNDTIIFNGGTGVLTGGAGADRFVFNAKPTTAVEIKDFAQGQDVLDLRPLLGAYRGASPVADGWVKFQTDSVRTTVLVDMDGPSGAGGFVSVANLTGVKTALTMGVDFLFASTGGAASGHQGAQQEVVANKPTTPAPTAPTTPTAPTAPVAAAPQPGYAGGVTPVLADIEDAVALARSVSNVNLIEGDAKQNNLVGTAGRDFIDGKAGLDTMSGGAGNDVYMVDNMRDRIVEAVDGGIDTVRLNYTSYTLHDNVENVVLVGNSVQRVEGNALNNVMIANGVSSTMNGGNGDDILVATGGRVSMTGGAGRDVFRFEDVSKNFKYDPNEITDFRQGEDFIDLSALLPTYTGNDLVGDKWVEFRQEANGLVVYADLDGPAGAAGMTAVVRLLGVSGSLTSSDFLV